MSSTHAHTTSEPMYGTPAYALQTLRHAHSVLSRAKPGGGGAMDFDAEELDAWFAIGAARSAIKSALEMLSDEPVPMCPLGQCPWSGCVCAHQADETHHTHAQDTL